MAGGWRASLGLLNRCFGVSELNSRDAAGCPGVLIRLCNRMRLVYHYVETKEVRCRLTTSRYGKSPLGNVQGISLYV